ncbi:DUF3703 domain-containing protein [Stackebrandtia soli]
MLRPRNDEGYIVIVERMPPRAKTAFLAELANARTAETSQRFWAADERAHILSQPWPWPNTWSHAAMLARAWREGDRVEAVGQVIRLLVAGPGSALGKYPEGNTGRARIGITRRMPVPADLAAVLAED